MFYCFLLLSFLIHANCFAKLDIQVAAESAILMNADTGVILYEKLSEKVQYPASITKVATALYALTVKGEELETLISANQDAIASLPESAIKKSNYTQPSYYIEQGSSHIGIKRGEELKFSDLLYGMMLPSANDAANVIAGFVSHSIPEFVKELNQYVKTLGCKNTNFCNPHGLHHPNHVTTALDMALITKQALKIPFFKKVVKTVRFTRPKTNKQEPTTLVQLNKLLKSGKYYYSNAVGVKTGHTSYALNTFISAAEFEGRTLILVLLKTKKRSDIFKDAKKVFEKAFSEEKMEKVLVREGKQTFVFESDAASKPVETYAKESVSLVFFPSEEPSIKSYLKWEELKFPVVKGQKVGELFILNETAKTKKTISLYAEEDVSESWSHWFKNLI